MWRIVLMLANRGIGCSPKLCRVVEQLEWNHLFRVTYQLWTQQGIVF